MKKTNHAIEVICNALQENKVPQKHGQAALLAVLVASMGGSGGTKQELLDLIDEAWEVIELKIARQGPPFTPEGKAWN